MPLIAAHIIGVVSLLAILYMRNAGIDGRSSPDCGRYLKMVVGKRVPAPFNRRVLVPLMARPWVALFGWSPHNVLRVVVFIGTLASVFSVVALALQLGVSTPLAYVCGAIFALSTFAVGCWLLYPWLVDSWSTALGVFGIVAALNESMILAAALMALAVLAKESGFLLALAFYAVLTGDYAGSAIIALPGMILHGLLLTLMTAAPPDTEILEHRIQSARICKRFTWLNWEKNLSGLHATPYVAALCLPYSPAGLAAVSTVVLAWMQYWIATDQGRLLALSLPFVIPATMLVAPAWAVAGWLLITLFWPFTEEYV